MNPAAEVAGLDESLQIDRLTAEFAHPGTELDFRYFIRDRRVSDTRLAIYIAAVFYLAFAVTDYLTMAGDGQYVVVLLLRLAVWVMGLAMATLAPKYADQVVDGLLPSLVSGVAMVAFIALTYLRPFSIGWHGMAMITMLYGVYVFIPNRFLPAMLICMTSSMMFMLTTLLAFDLHIDEVVRLLTLIVVTNILGAMTNYRLSRLMREEYREHAVLKRANRKLQLSIDERLNLENAMRQRAETDEATGVANRAAFFRQVNALLEAAGDSPARLSVLVVNIDYFRQVIRTYGHTRSDEVLRALVSACRSVLAEGQLLARLGGGEFIVLLPGVELAEAGLLAERIREECARTPVALVDVYVHFTVSIGGVAFRAGEPFIAVLRRADEAVQAAKYKGRNRVEVMA